MLSQFFITNEACGLSLIPDTVIITLVNLQSLNLDTFSIIGKIPFFYADTSLVFLYDVNDFDFNYFNQVRSIKFNTGMYNSYISSLYENLHIPSYTHTCPAHPCWALYLLFANNIHLVVTFFCLLLFGLLSSAINAVTASTYNCLSYVYYASLSHLLRLLELLVIMLQYTSKVLNSTLYNRYLSIILLILVKVPYVYGSLGNNGILFGRKIIAGLGTFLFIILSSVYDFTFRKYISIDRYIQGRYNKKRLAYRLLLGVIYQLYIFVGVGASTAFWILNFGEKLYLNMMWVAFSIPICYLASIAWLWLGSVSIKNQLILGESHMRITIIQRLANFLIRHYTIISVLRGICEAVNFTFLSYIGFTLWTYWTSYWQNSLKGHLIGFASALIIYLLSSFLQIYYEFSFRRYLLYGFLYVVSFTSLSICTNGIIFAFINRVSVDHLHYIFGITLILVIALPITLYRELGDNGLLDLLLQVIIGQLYFFAAFLAFALETYLIFTLWLNLLIT